MKRRLSPESRGISVNATAKANFQESKQVPNLFEWNGSEAERKDELQAIPLPNSLQIFPNLFISLELS